MEELEALERAAAWDAPAGPWAGGPGPWGPPPGARWRGEPRGGDPGGAGGRPRLPARRRAWGPGALAEAMMGMLAEDGPLSGAHAAVPAPCMPVTACGSLQPPQPQQWSLSAAVLSR